MKFLSKDPFQMSSSFRGKSYFRRTFNPCCKVDRDKPESSTSVQIKTTGDKDDLCFCARHDNVPQSAKPAQFSGTIPTKAAVRSCAGARTNLGIGKDPADKDAANETPGDPAECWQSDLTSWISEHLRCILPAETKQNSKNSFRSEKKRKGISVVW
jgi:hypothetical protein